MHTRQFCQPLRLLTSRLQFQTIIRKCKIVVYNIDMASPNSRSILDTSPHVVALAEERIRSELSLLGVSDSEASRVTPIIIGKIRQLTIQPGLASERFFSTDSAFFHFREKVQQVVSQFRADGLTEAAYLKAALKQPSLFTRSPVAISRHVEAVAKYLGEHGVSTAGYVSAALRVPSLLCLDASNVIRTMETVCCHFAANGLGCKEWANIALRHPVLMALSSQRLIDTVNQFVAAHAEYGLTYRGFFRLAERQPSLLTHSVDSIVRNRQEIVRRLEAHGLSVGAFTRASFKQPSLFCYSPDTLESHVLELGRRLERDGVEISRVMKACLARPSLLLLNPNRVARNLNRLAKTLGTVGASRGEAVRAAFRNPQLLYMDPETISRNVNQIMAMHASGQFTLRPARMGASAYQGCGLEGALARFLVSNPTVLLLDSTNYALRSEYQRLLGTPLSSQLLLASRHSIEAETMRLLGHDEPLAPVPPSASPHLLRLIRSGLIKSALIESE